MLEIKSAVRRAAPMLMSISGVSGSGKTFSALLLAAGIAGDNGVVTLIDTEAGRGSLYADSPGIVKALPNGYKIIDLPPDHSPERYTQALQLAEQSGSTVTVVDSGSHEFEGIGGVCEIAEKNLLGRMPNWSKAKIAHKKFMNYVLSSKMNIIFCLRAREKVKIFKKGDIMAMSPTDLLEGSGVKVADKDTIVPIGIHPIQEKGFVFEMLVSIMLDEHSHHAIPLKVPEPLLHLFPGRRLITKQDGERIREWNESGAAGDPTDRLKRQARAAASEGVAAYKAFFTALSKPQQKILADTIHEELKLIGEQADIAAAAAQEQEERDAIQQGESTTKEEGATTTNA